MTSAWWSVITSRIVSDSVMTGILGTFFILVSVCSGVSALNSSVSLTFAPGTVGEGENLTMQCAVLSGIQNVSWIRNNISIFSTSNGTLAEIKTENSTFDLVAGRMIVTSSNTKHNVTLTINSTLDGGSVWQCMVGDKISSQLEISVSSASIEVSSSQAATFVTGEKSTSDISSIMPTTEDSSVRTTTAQTTKEDVPGISSRNTATVDSTTTVLPAEVSTTTSTALSDTVTLTPQTATITPIEESTTRRTTLHPSTGITDKITASTIETSPSLGKDVSQKDESIFIVIGSIVGVIAIYICIMIVLCGTRNKRTYSPRKVSSLKRQRPNHDSQDGYDNQAMTASDCETEFGSVDENRTIDDVEDQMPDKEVFADSGNDGYPDPQYTTGGDAQFSTGGDPQYSTAGDPQYSTAGDPQYSTAGDPQCSTAGDPQYSTAGDPQYSTVGDHQYITDLDPQYSTAEDPQYSTAGDPQCSTAGDPQYSTAGDPQYSHAGDPQCIAGGEIGETAEGRAVMQEETQVTDVYAQVQKNGGVTDDQVEVNVDELYAKPIKDKFCIHL